MKQPQLVNNTNYILNPHLSDIVWPDKGSEIGLDTETSGTAAWRDKCRIVTLHLEDTTYLLQPEFYTREELHQLVAIMLDYLVVAHGAKFDIGFMYALSGIWLTNVWCTQVGSQLLGGGRRLWKHTLTHSLSRYLKIELGEDKKEMQKSFLVDRPLTDEQFAYAAKDVKYLVQLKKELLFQINNMRLDKVLKLELALIPVLAEMEFEGCLVDVAAWRELLKEWEIKKKEYLGLLDAEVMRIYPMMLFPNINYGSPQQVTRLFKDLGLPVPMKDEGKDKGSRPSTEESVLEMYLNEYPGTPVQKFVELLLQYREYEKLISTYGASFLDRVDSRNHIHTIYSQTSTATHRLSSKEPNCFIGEVEVLTLGGWRRFDEVYYDREAVATWDNGQITFVNPDSWQHMRNRPIIHLETRSVSLPVTEDHRCLLRTRQGEYKDIIAKDYVDDHQQLHAGWWWGGEGLELSDSEIRLIVAIQADGSITPHNKVDFSFHRRRKISRIQELMKGQKYKRIKAKPPRTRFSLDAPHLVRYKFFGPWVFQLSRRQIDIFLEELFFWDGSFTRKNNYASADKRGVDFVQALFCLSGRRARYRKYTNSLGSVSHQLDIVNTDYSWTTNHTKTHLGLRDVYCCSVPSGYIVVRHNGKVMITGQCQNIPSTKSGDGAKVRKFFLARPGYKMITSDMEGAEIRLAGDFSGEPVIVDAMMNDKDMHSHLASVSFSIICNQPVTITKTKEPLVINGIEIIPEDARDIHKSVTFSKFYKGGPPRVYQVLARYINKFHKAGTRMEIATQISYAIDNALPVLTAYLSRLIKQANIQGYLITTKLGRRRYFDTKVYGEAANAPIQGSNADAMKIAMVRMYRYLKETGYGRLVLTVHDELVVEAKEEHAEEVAKVLQKEMADALGYFLTVIPGKAGVKINDHWEK